MRAFIVRPFGTQEDIDFDRVEAELIRPALKTLRAMGFDVDGGTTTSIVSAGGIREDMFRLLAVSDLVIADVSIHNANVFYELGIRHALQPGNTFLIRGDNRSKYPFDLQTDRYFTYDVSDPGAHAVALATALRSTLADQSPDSPIFRLLPGLTTHDRQDSSKVPSSFADDVQLARNAGERGLLRLFAEEVRSFEWYKEGLRLIGDAQFVLRAYSGARETFELIRRSSPDDVHANCRLATIYQRQAVDASPLERTTLLTNSDRAIDRALAVSNNVSDKAEAWALKGSNAKSRWMDQFTAAAPDQRAVVALASPRLDEMLEYYLRAYYMDLNSHYPGVNALNLLRAQIALAEREPAAWNSQHGSDREADEALSARRQLAIRLSSALCLALVPDDVMGNRMSLELDHWALSSCADLSLTTLDNAARVGHRYLEAVTGAEQFALEAMRRTVRMFQELGLFEPNLTAARDVIDQAIRAFGANDDINPAASTPARVLMFTGHMVDAPDRPASKRRFPRTAKAEATARALIEDAIKAEIDGETGTVIGIASGANGGDILFHEACERLGVRTAVYLALPQNMFQAASVQSGGPDWVDRYQSLCSKVNPRVLQAEERLPDWLVDKPDYNVWQRCNYWMLFSALATDAKRQTLIALYNPDMESDGAGGTSDFVKLAEARGVKSVRLDARKLLVE